MYRNIVIFGATGSIGSSAINVIRRNRDKISIAGIAAYSNVEKLAAIAREFDVDTVGIYCETALNGKKELFRNGTNFFFGEDGLCDLAQLQCADGILVATSGTVGIPIVMSGIVAKKDILLASKEVLVVAGKYIMREAAKNNVNILPIDSEHNAIFQCLRGEKITDVRKLILTASGGPFRNLSKEEIKNVTIEQALNHPTWKMGKKISVDSATMVNKGLEIIEARWLFDIPAAKIDVVIHPESIIHSMVEFCDHSIIAQLCPTSMEFPIKNCLFYPNRNNSTACGLNFNSNTSITFESPDIEKFPCLGIARHCLSAGGNACAVFESADEVAVDAFLKKEIPFSRIFDVISKTLEIYSGEPDTSLQNCILTFNNAKNIAKIVLKSMKEK